MGMFSKSTDKQLTDAKASRDTLNSRLITAQALVTEHKTAAQKAARDGVDDAALDKIEAKLRTQQIRVDTLSAALAESEQHISQIEQAIEEQRVEAQRADNVKLIEGYAADLAIKAPALDRALEAVSNLTGEIVPWCADAQGLHVFTSSARVEIMAAVSMLGQLLWMHANSRPVFLAKPAPPQPLPKPAPTMHVTALKAVTWLVKARFRSQPLVLISICRQRRRSTLLGSALFAR